MKVVQASLKGPQAQVSESMADSIDMQNAVGVQISECRFQSVQYDRKGG